MRVNYTLPGLAMTPAPAAVPLSGEGPSFRSRLRRMAGPLPRSWKQVLRLEDLPVTGTLIGPPPQPPGLELLDTAAERRRWRGLLARHTRTLDPGPQPDSRPVSRMMALLLEYQSREDAMTARHLSEVRG